MLSAKEALDITKSKDPGRQELDILQHAISITANSGEGSLHLSTGLTADWRKKQDKLYPNFKGRLYPSTIKTLEALGYVVSTSTNNYSDSVYIQWDHGE